MKFWRKQLSRSQPELSEGSVGHLDAYPVQKTEKEEWKKQQEKEDRDEKTKGEDEGKGPPNGPVNGKERLEVLLQGPEAGDHGCHWAVHRVTTWLQLQLPQTEDGKSFEEGVRADEHPSHQAGRLPQWSRVPGPHWWSVETHRACAVLYDVILKNFKKLRKPRGESKEMMYWDSPLILWWAQ